MRVVRSWSPGGGCTRPGRLDRVRCGTAGPLRDADSEGQWGFRRGIRVRQDLSLAHVRAVLARNSGEDSPGFSRASSTAECASLSVTSRSGHAQRRRRGPGWGGRARRAGEGGDSLRRDRPAAGGCGVAAGRSPGRTARRCRGAKPARRQPPAGAPARRRSQRRAARRPRLVARMTSARRRPSTSPRADGSLPSTMSAGSVTVTLERAVIEGSDPADDVDRVRGLDEREGLGCRACEDDPPGRRCHRRAGTHPPLQRGHEAADADGTAIHGREIGEVGRRGSTGSRKPAPPFAAPVTLGSESACGGALDRFAAGAVRGHGPHLHVGRRGAGRVAGRRHPERPVGRCP